MIELWDILDENGNKTGYLHQRGKPMKRGEYHLVVHIWIMNSQGEFLISKRSSNKLIPHKWESTGGSVVAGEDSLTAAIREVKEELGIVLDPQNGQLFKHFRRDFENFIDVGGDFVDVWFFCQDIDISTVIFQPDETCDAIWASKDKIIQMINDELFIDTKINFPYLDELFLLSKNLKFKD